MAFQHVACHAKENAEGLARDLSSVRSSSPSHTPKSEGITQVHAVAGFLSTESLDVTSFALLAAGCECYHNGCR